MRVIVHLWINPGTFGGITWTEARYQLCAGYTVLRTLYGALQPNQREGYQGEVYEAINLSRYSKITEQQVT